MIGCLDTTRMDAVLAAAAANVAGRGWRGHFGRYGGFTAAGGTDVDRGITLVALGSGSADESPAETIRQALAVGTTDRQERG